MAKVITITSGKGGVGKTSISLNLSLALAVEGFRVCLFDADLGLANVNILTGIFPEHGLEQVISGDLTLEDILVRNFQGIDIIPGSSGIEKIADLTPRESRRLINSFLALKAYDYFILDTSAGISSQVLSFCRASHEMILVVTPEPTSLTDAYSLLKVLSKHKTLPRVKVVINQVKTATAAKNAYTRLKETVHKFLPIRITPLGIVAQDRNVPISIISQNPFFVLFPETHASRCIRAIAIKLGKEPGATSDMPMELFWDQCLQFLSHETQAKSLSRTGAKKALDRQTAPGQTDGVSAGDDLESPKERQRHLALQERLSNIEDKISRLLDEVMEIKALLPQAGRGENEQEPLVPLPDLPLPRPISLDFESWLKEQPF